MKKQIPLVILSSLLITSCNLTSDYTTFEEYVDIVKNAQENQKDIFFFTASNCQNCQSLTPLVEKYIAQNTNELLNIYILSVDYKIKFDGSTVFKDKTMGLITGDASNDCIEILDNRLIEYINHVYPDGKYPNYIFQGDSEISNYLYVYTPLVIWYDSGIEVKMANNVLSAIQSDSDGNLMYDSFAEFMKFPEEYPTWDKEFNLDYYKQK